MKIVQYIHDLNKETMNKPADTDQIYYSELSEWSTGNAFRSFSIKYALEGVLQYKINRTEYKVATNHFLVAPKQPEVKAYFVKNQPIRSLCIDICEQSISDAITVFNNESKNQVTDFTTDHFNHPSFGEKVYTERDNLLGERLQQLSRQVTTSAASGEELVVNSEWFLGTVDLIVQPEARNVQMLNKLNALKASTRREIFKRVMTGRDYIDMSFLQNPDILNIARHSNMSVFHFYRSFRQVMGTSPYQYMLIKRLEHARSLLMEGNNFVSEIAFQCGFPDVFTFSKAFKRKFGSSPSQFLPRNKS